MFDIGWSEFLFLAVLVLIVVGPQELPGLMRRLGQMTSTVRNAALQFQLNLKALDRENSMAELKKFADDVSPKNILNQVEKDISDVLTPPDILDDNLNDTLNDTLNETVASSDVDEDDIPNDGNKDGPK